MNQSTPGAALRLAILEESPLQIPGAINANHDLLAKRCGHRPNKEIVSQGEMLDRIKAAVDARTDDSFVITARTDPWLSRESERHWNGRSRASKPVPT